MTRDYIELGTDTPIDKFNNVLSKVVVRFTREHKPFDEPCARLDFKDRLEALQKESERVLGFAQQEMKIEESDFEKYGDISRFEFLEDQEDVQDKVIEGSRTQVLIGHTLSYKCKQRGHKIAVFVPIAEYNEMKRKTK